MSKQHPANAEKFGRVRDARGRWVSQLDPVRLHVLSLRSNISSETLQAIVDELVPGAKRQRLLLVLSVILGFVFVVGGNVVYFRYFSSWKGFDPVNVTIYGVQALVLLAGPAIAYFASRKRYAHRIVSVMLEHNHCPHCGYDMRGLPRDPTDDATVCPECGCAWRPTSNAD